MVDAHWSGLAIGLTTGFGKTLKKQFVSVFTILLPGLILGGCIGVPDVESRLQTLRFHPNMYVVQAGDTLDSIAHRYQMTPNQLASMNRQAGAGGIRPGDRINVRPGTELSSDVRNRTGSGWLRSDQVANRNSRPSRPVNTAVIARRTQAPQVETGATVQVPSRDVVVAQTQPATVVESHSVTSAGVVEEIIADDFVADQNAVVRSKVPVPTSVVVGSSEWRWPSAGEVVREYAPNEVNGQGVDIAGVPGQDVMAAADGTVVYTGRDLSNSGNLVILRHDGNLLSTYSHAKDLYVGEDDFVKAGDPIASLGWNAARESVLHFELRKEGKPVNPMTYLPAR